MAQDMAVTTTTDKNPLQLNYEDGSFQSLDNDPPELRNIPPIRDNPEMAETTSKRRSSVANPHSIQYRNPTHDSSSNENNSTTDEDGDDEQDSEYDDDNDDVFSATNENINDDDDPSISDLNEINNDINKIMNRPPISQNYQPINQREDNDNNNDNDDEIDPFARLGQKQESIALPPLINALAQQQQVQQQIIVNKLNRIKQFDNRNPYSPDAILDPKHLQRHSRAGSKHSRSQTLANSGYMRGNNTQMIQQRQRNNKRLHQHKSSSVDWSGGMNGPPSGPDLTFVCMRIENRTILQNSLSDTEFMQLMQIHNAIMLDGLKHFNGHCIEQFNGHVYDVLTVFNDVYDAIRCAINIQKELNNYKWPIFYYKLEKESNQMQYVGKSRNKNAFNGIRVGMGLHTATVGTNKNKYDGGKETCHVETIIFDATYKGTAVELVKALCIKSYGGELLATKAVSQALLRSKKGGDEISLQGLGTCSIHKIRSVELIELIPRDLPHRMFPPRSLMTHATNHLTQESNLLLVDEQSETPSYDPFPNPKPNPKPNNNNDDNHDEEYDTTKENDSDDSSHSSKDGIQHNPNISSYNRRPSITQIGPVGPDTQIEVSFTGGDDEYDIYDDNNNDNDSNNNSNNEYKQSYDNNLLGIDHYKKKQIVEKGMDTSSDHSLGPPKKHQTRVKAHEIEKRKSGIHIMNMMQFQQNNDKMNMKSKKKDIKKKKNKRKHKYDGDDERSPLPDERDYERNAIHGPKRAPRTNKKKEHYKTMVGIDFDPDADSSVYSAGSRSIRTSTTVKSYISNKLLNPEHQLKLYKTRPAYLPSAYSDDREFTCLSCQEIRKWTDGVWRVPMWPSFDVCIACGNKELQTGTSKKELKEFDPMNGNHNNNNNIYSPHDQHNQFGDISNVKHRKVPSTAPIMKEYIENINNNNEYKMTQEALEMLRKQLSSIIEELTDQKLQRLDNLSSWAKIDKEFEEWKAKINAEHTATEDEINSWRKRAKRLDEQDQRVLRRKHTVDLESPTASDLGSDEELHQNWQDYDYKDDFATIHDRIKDLDSLFWTEDEFFKKKFENISISNGNKFKSLQQKYSQTTHELQQRNDELTSKMHTIMSNNDGVGGDNRYNDMDGDGTDSDDLEREDTEKYQKYIPPTVKHIHENSQAIQGINPQQLNAPNRDYENNDDDDINHINHINDRQKVMVLENTLKEYDEKIDHYISTVNRKDRELKELKQQVGYLEQMNETEEEFAALHDELERTKREKADLESKLKMYVFDEPVEPVQPIDSTDDNSIFDDFAADQKELDAMEQQNNNNNNIMDDNAVQLMKDNEIRLKAANVEIDKLEEQIEKIKTENNRLAVTKMESLNKLSLQIEEMRDEIQHQCQQLQLKDHTIKKLIHINKEGYDPDTDMDQKHDFETRKISNSLINGIGGSLGISNSLNGLLTFGRSKYSTCLHSQQTKKSKIDLAIETSKEIHRLREIIRVLSTNKTTNGSQTNNTNKSSKYGLFDGIYPGSK